MGRAATYQGLVGKTGGVAARMDTLSVLLIALNDFGARSVLDLGCGDGAIARQLAEKGLAVTGVDPSEDALARARIAAPDIDFICGRAEALPPDLPRTDAAIFVNTLHHVPSGSMADALLGAVGAVRDGGGVLVIEPMAQGSFFRAMHPVDDERAARAEAHQTIDRLISTERIALRALRRWNRENCFKDLDEFVGYLSRTSPKRAGTAARNEARLARAWRNNIRSQDGMAVLIQPMICWTLTAPGRPVKLNRL